MIQHVFSAAVRLAIVPVMVSASVQMITPLAGSPWNACMVRLLLSLSVGLFWNRFTESQRSWPEYQTKLKRWSTAESVKAIRQNIVKF